MAKKLICFPFIDGNLQEYSYHNLDDSERERVYNGEEVVKEFIRYFSIRDSCVEIIFRGHGLIFVEGDGREKLVGRVTAQDIDGNGVPSIERELKSVVAVIFEGRGFA